MGLKSLHQTNGQEQWRWCALGDKWQTIASLYVSLEVGEIWHVIAEAFGRNDIGRDTGDTVNVSFSTRVLACLNVPCFYGHSIRSNESVICVAYGTNIMPERHYDSQARHRHWEVPKTGDYWVQLQVRVSSKPLREGAIEFWPEQQLLSMVRLGGIFSTA